MVFVVAALALLLWFVLHRDASAVPTRTQSHAAPVMPGGGGSAAAPAGPVAHVTRLAPDERRQVADRIAAAHSARVRPELPPPDPASSLKESLRHAVRDVIPYLTDCFEKAIPTLPGPHVTVTAKMTLTGDADIGTLIDAHELVDDEGNPLPRAFDECLRTTLQSLELPPLAEGDVVEVHYPFEFYVTPH
jgi:hypothetical protein